MNSQFINQKENNTALAGLNGVPVYPDVTMRIMHYHRARGHRDKAVEYARKAVNMLVGGQSIAYVGDWIGKKLGYTSNIRHSVHWPALKKALEKAAADRRKNMPAASTQTASSTSSKPVWNKSLLIAGGAAVLGGAFLWFRKK